MGGKQLAVVLILILMEHAQKADGMKYIQTLVHHVLILILMEHAQREHFL